ncbi:MAG: GNAT family N-acetyltransferase [Aggregatilineaceae bacterium]
MPLRPFRLPADLDVIITLLPPSFQYPENEAWNIRQDEIEGMVDSLRGIRRLWPVVRLLQALHPPLRDALCGFIWEEDEQPVGLTNIIRMGNTDRWLIGNVAVLPEYRRRGIARRLVEASVAYARERGAASVVLDVIAGNEPAYRLYESLGFVHYDDRYELNCAPAALLADLPLPDGYRLTPCPQHNWRPRYELARRITPEAVRRYLPVEEGHFRQPFLMRLIAPLFLKAEGVRVQTWLAHHTASGQIVASARSVMRRRSGGNHRIEIDLDPAHEVLAHPLLAQMLRSVASEGSQHPVELQLPRWQAPLIDAAQQAGFVLRYEYRSMGLILRA